MSAAFPSRWLLERSIAAPALAYIAFAVGSGNRRIEPRSGVRFGEALDCGRDGTTAAETVTGFRPPRSNGSSRTLIHYS